MRPKLSIAVVGIGVLLATTPALGHHPLVAQYDVNRPITLTGTLTNMEWANPHGWLYVDVEGREGKVENWAIETGGPYSLLKRGLRTTDFLPGIEIVVSGVLAKDGTRSVAGEKITFPDRQVAFQLGR